MFVHLVIVCMFIVTKPRKLQLGRSCPRGWHTGHTHGQTPLLRPVGGRGTCKDIFSCGSAKNGENIPLHRVILGDDDNNDDNDDDDDNGEDDDDDNAVDDDDDDYDDDDDDVGNIAHLTSGPLQRVVVGAAERLRLPLQLHESLILLVVGSLAAPALAPHSAPRVLDEPVVAALGVRAVANLDKDGASC